MKRKLKGEGVDIIRPGGDWKHWRVGFYHFSNRFALSLARFIARFNGYRLVKEPPKV